MTEFGILPETTFEKSGFGPHSRETFVGRQPDILSARHSRSVLKAPTA